MAQLFDREGLGEDNRVKNTYNSKKQLRTWAKQTRSKLNMSALSKILVEKLKQTEEYKQAQNIMIFYPLKDEVDLLDLLEDKTKTFYLPKIDGENLLCCKFDKNTELCESCFHTKEPVNTQIAKSPDLVIVPALAVDKNNYRLGYGKGFYDRFLSQFNPPVKTIVCTPKELIVESIFPNEYDIPISLIITD